MKAVNWKKINSVCSLTDEVKHNVLYYSISQDLTTTGFKPTMVDQETSMEPVAMATASTQVDMKVRLTR